MIRLFVLMLLVTSAIRTGTKDARYSLTVTVSGLRNSNGVAQFALYNRDHSIPDEHFRNACGLLRREIREGAARVTFPDLPRGRYAVSVLHDENANGKIDKGLLLPKEGIGFSNMVSVGPANRPSFRKAAFEIAADTAFRIHVVYL